MPEEPTGQDGPFDVHCGRCKHVYFQADWNRTPYCTFHDRETTIRVGDICAQFEEWSDADGGSSVGQERADIEYDESETVHGTTGPFYAVYSDDRLREWYCSNCAAVVDVADPMGRLKCSGCGNFHQPNEWDSAYL